MPTKRGDKSQSEIFVNSGLMATPNNGMEAFYEFISQNLKYPDAAIKAGIEGRVFVNFNIDKNGRLYDFKLVRGIGMVWDEEAIRLLKLSLSWMPAKHNGEAVVSTFSMPIVFKLNQ